MTDEVTIADLVRVDELNTTRDDEVAIEGVVAVYRNTKTGVYRTAVVCGFTADRGALLLDTDGDSRLTTVHQGSREDERFVRLHTIELVDDAGHGAVTRRWGIRRPRRRR
ncbi:hypothetical protein [Amycolatopsis sp. cmx-4-68]|uniref:hypothetical protein n=1 Tax=Amycolatopsis sp. cmx-4-68 TaxID=2790938 RepID=UPI00397C1B23